jgi:hypothetical protein
MQYIDDLGVGETETSRAHQGSVELEEAYMVSQHLHVLVGDVSIILALAHCKFCIDISH